MKPCDPAVTFRRFSAVTSGDLLQDVSDAILRALQSPDAEAVHKLRVSIRRFQQSLRLFSQFFRKKGLTAVRRELKSIMTPAGELRNYDIAVGLLRRAKADASMLKANRLQARAALLEALNEVGQEVPAERWRRSLELEPE